MVVQERFDNPLCIRIGYCENVVLSDTENIPLSPGILYDSKHYGFVLIIDFNGKQKELVFPTQCSVNAVGYKDSLLKLFENGKKNPWVFDKYGKLLQSNLNDFTNEFIDNYKIELKNRDTFVEDSIILDPICLKISRNPKESVILGNDSIKKEYPLNPGAIIGDIHYGFVLIIDTLNGQKEVVYPTHNIIDAVGVENGEFGDIKIYEKGKYQPWIFTYDGKLKKEASLEFSSNNDFSLCLKNSRSGVL